MFTKLPDGYQSTVRGSDTPTAIDSRLTRDASWVNGYTHHLEVSLSVRELYFWITRSRKPPPKRRSFGNLPPDLSPGTHVASRPYDGGPLNRGASRTTSYPPPDNHCSEEVPSQHTQHVRFRETKAQNQNIPKQDPLCRRHNFHHYFRLLKNQGGTQWPFNRIRNPLMDGGIPQPLTSM